MNQFCLWQAEFGSVSFASDSAFDRGCVEMNADLARLGTGARTAYKSIQYVAQDGDRLQSFKPSRDQRLRVDRGADGKLSDTANGYSRNQFADKHRPLCRDRSDQTASDMAAIILRVYSRP